MEHDMDTTEAARTTQTTAIRHYSIAVDGTSAQVSLYSGDEIVDTISVDLDGPSYNPLDDFFTLGHWCYRIGEAWAKGASPAQCRDMSTPAPSSLYDDRLLDEAIPY
jgi:hypothetical protein